MAGNLLVPVAGVVNAVAGTAGATGSGLLQPVSGATTATGGVTGLVGGLLGH